MEGNVPSGSGGDQPVFQGGGAPDDAVTKGILAGEGAPRTIHAVRDRLQEYGGVMRTHIVANGGHEQPRPRDGEVMFMAFETYEGPIPGDRVEPGELFLGFFLRPRDGTLTIGDGFVELIAWDRRKELFNWWRDGQELPLGDFRADAAATRILSRATDASSLARQVKLGIDRLVGGAGAVTSLRLRLRSLFSTMEMNLESDSTPFKNRLAAGAAIEIPAAFFVDSRLSGGPADVAVDLSAYRQALEDTDSRFPPDAGQDSREARHAFLVPTRSYMDNRVIDRLIDDGLLDAELVADVLAIDMWMPVYSDARASLMRYVPDTAGDVHELRERLVATLREAPMRDQAARDLLGNLINPARTAEVHRRAAATYLDACRGVARTPRAIAGWLRYAQTTRGAIERADTARHPLGLITEEGFRRIFPRLHAAEPQALRLGPACLAEPRS
jgi:hypothetical protein